MRLFNDGSIDELDEFENNGGSIETSSKNGSRRKKSSNKTKKNVPILDATAVNIADTIETIQAPNIQILKTQEDVKQNDDNIVPSNRK